MNKQIQSTSVVLAVQSHSHTNQTAKQQPGQKRKEEICTNVGVHACATHQHDDQGVLGSYVIFWCPCIKIKICSAAFNHDTVQTDPETS